MRKRRWICLLVLLLAAHVGFAQDQPSTNAEDMAVLIPKLALSQDQVLAVRPINRQYAVKRQKLLQQLDVEEAKALSTFLSVQQVSQWKRLQHLKGEEKSD